MPLGVPLRCFIGRANFHRILSHFGPSPKVVKAEERTQKVSFSVGFPNDTSNTLAFALHDQRKQVQFRLCEGSRGLVIFVDAPGGYGKTYVEDTILAAVRTLENCRNPIALAVATSGIASTLLQGERTFHSRFKALKVTGESTLNISAQREEAMLIKNCLLSVWDEAPMAHRFLMEALDKTLRDITGKQEPFGIPLRSSSQRINFPQKGKESVELLRPNNTKVDLHVLEFNRHGLTCWPKCSNSDCPRSISLRHNRLVSVDPPIHLPSLILLDLYQNHIEHLTGLEATPNLRILLLAKNRLSHIDGLKFVPKLEILDLHGNQLRHFNGLSHLKELRVLNLAGNMLRHVTSLHGLDSLMELNLRRNQIRTVSDCHLLPCLEKVFLSFNEIYRYEDISSLQKCIRLQELSLDHNPISKQKLYYHIAAVKFYRIRRLDERDLTAEIRRQSERVIQKAKDREKTTANQINDDERRKIAINSAMRHWKTLKAAHHMMVRRKSSTPTSSGKSPKGNHEETEDVNKKYDTEDLPPFEKDLESTQQASKDNTAKQEIEIDIMRQSPVSERTDIAAKTAFSKQNSAPEIHIKNAQQKFKLGRSKSSFEIKSDNCEFNEITNSSISLSGSVASHKELNSSNEGIFSPSMTRKASDSELTPKVIRRHSESRLSLGKSYPANTSSRYKYPVATNFNSSEKKISTSRTSNRVLQKSESSPNFKSLPDRFLTAAVSKIQTNLHLLRQKIDTKVSFTKASSPNPKTYSRENLDFQESSDEEDSSSELISSVSSATKEDGMPFNPLCSSKTLDLINKQVSKTHITSVTSDRNQGGVLREEGANFLAELDDDVIRLFGSGALKCTELMWEKNATASVTTVSFQYINYDEISEIFPRLRTKFPRLENFIFTETNLTKCCQLNALAELHQVNSVHIKSDGNPLVGDCYWRHYAVFRLSHWGLTTINGIEISETERQEAACFFNPLSQLAFNCLPRQQLNILISAKPEAANAIDNDISSLGSSGPREESGNGSECSRLNVPYLHELIGKEALQYRALKQLSEVEATTLSNAGTTVNNLVKWSLESVLRLRQLEKAWPSVLHDLAREAVTDIIKPNYGKNCLESLKKEMAWKK